MKGQHELRNNITSPNAPFEPNSGSLFAADTTMMIENSEELSLEFAINQLRDRTDPAVATFAFDITDGMYFITSKLPIGDYDLLSTMTLPSCFNPK